MLENYIIQIEAGSNEELFRKYNYILKEIPENIKIKQALVFISVDLDEKVIVDSLKERWSDIDVSGCTSSANCSDEILFSEDSVLIILFNDQIDTQSGLIESLNDHWGNDLDFKNVVKNQSEGFLFVFPVAGPIGERFVNKLSEDGTVNIPVIGGGAGRHALTRMKPRQFNANKSVNSGCAWLYLNGDFDIEKTVVHGWKPVGPEMVITKSDGASIFTLDNTPALEVFKYYFGEHQRPAFEFPMLIKTLDEVDLFRVPVSYDESCGAVHFGAGFAEYSRIQLCESNAKLLIESSKKASEELLKNKVSKGGVIFSISCNARRGLLGTQVIEEWNDLRLYGRPVVGFYAFAEYASSSKDGVVHVHNMTQIQLNLSSDTHKFIQIKPQKEDTRDLLLKKNEREFFHRKSLERIKENHEQLLKRLTDQLDAEKKKSESLLLNILPVGIAEELKEAGEVKPRSIECATVLFTDFKGFTASTKSMSPRDVLKRLNESFCAFDQIIRKYGLEKLKTIGDAYMCAGGILDEDQDHREGCIRASLEIRDWVIDWNKKYPNDPWHIRVGVHCGPLIAGVIGDYKFTYDIWGDTVNVASRLESLSEANEINVSESIYNALKHKDYIFKDRGKLAVKNHGELQMYFINRA